ncbi:hypothetical protein MO867_06025 [Microbulbifer sp. OS29]|uniref:Uncharacterized protein n=1 Tax=Microbulbifer okhotskensis TaxID=2926617 RepID=A0A9X2ELM1_9GAMM|nr:hypothetical protein [Microbulbifer okhotskensis]MCO1333894.1 hypothetical protein [Microbulbifer okhotskensis]
MVNRQGAIVKAVAFLASPGIRNGNSVAILIPGEFVVVGRLPVDGIAPLAYAAGRGAFFIPFKVKAVTGFQGALGNNMLVIFILLAESIRIGGFYQVAFIAVFVLGQYFNAAIASFFL